MVLFAVSASLLAIGWALFIGGLYLAIKYKEADNINKSKRWFKVSQVGEFIGDVSIYVVMFSIIAMVLRTLGIIR